MGSLNPENEPKHELNDSGYVQDYSAAKETSSTELPVKSSINLLDLSDDVLLYVLRYCSPRDLKALGYTCSRLGTLVLDRTLWQRVDARDYPTGKHRMRWFLTHALSVYTTRLQLSGFAREAKGCLGFMSGSRDESPLQAGVVTGIPEDSNPFTITASGSPEDNNAGPGLMRLSAQALPRYGGGFPFWPEQAARATATFRPREPRPPEHTGHRCPGPQVTLTGAALRRLTALCTNLTDLALDYVIIDCNMTNICMFPRSLRKLSLRGTKCFNLEKSFLYKIQDHLVLLEDLDVSYCEWVEPACMLPLSKVTRLARLVMRDCPKLSEFVAYASLATRYGFKTLKILDLRGCPVGDSEVSALGWVPQLEQLYLSPAPAAPRHADHAHLDTEPPPSFRELAAWEEQEPEYYSCKYASEPWYLEEQKRRPSRNKPGDENAIGSCVLLQHVTAPVTPSQNALERDGNTCRLPRTEPSRPFHIEQILAEQTRELEREREDGRARANMGYVMSNNGCRTINMYPDDEMEQEKDGDEASNKRKQENADGSGPSKRQKDLNLPSSSGNHIPGNDKDKAVPNENYPSDEKVPSNEKVPDEPMCSKEPCATKASRKYYDDANCQVSRQVLKNSLRDFKKRTQDMYGPILKQLRDDTEPDFVDSDDDPEMMDNDDDDTDDDDDDDDAPQPKRGRMAVNEGASTSKTEPMPDDSQSSTSKNFNEQSTQPSLSTQQNFSTQQSFSTQSSCTNHPSCSNQSNDSTQQSRSTTRPSNLSTETSHYSITIRSIGNEEIGMSLTCPTSEINENIRQMAKYMALGDHAPSPTLDEPDEENDELDPSDLNDEEIQAPAVNNEPGQAPTLNKPGQSSTSNKPDQAPTLNESGQSSTLNKPGQASTSNKPSQAPTSNKPDQSPILNNQPSQSPNLNNKPGEASTSNKPGQPPTPNKPGQPPTLNNEPGQPSAENNEPMRFVRFRHNEPAIIIEGCSAGCSAYNSNFNNNVYNNNNSQEPDWNNRFVVRDPMISGVPEAPVEQMEIDPRCPNGDAPSNAPADAPGAEEPRRHRILYVNVGRRRHAMYQISMPEPVDLRTQRPPPSHMNLVYSSQLTPRLDYASLVSDSAIRRFGRADDESINYVQIGPAGPVPAPLDDPHARPNRSNLRVLSVTGYTQISNDTLNHLMTAAPRLRLLDLRGTRVTETAVEHFRNFRPDCVVRIGPYWKLSEDSTRPRSR